MTNTFCGNLETHPPHTDCLGVKHIEFDDTKTGHATTIKHVENLRRFLQETNRDLNAWSITTVGPETQFRRMTPPPGEVTYAGYITEPDGIAPGPQTLEIYELRRIGTATIWDETLPGFGVFVHPPQTNKP